MLFFPIPSSALSRSSVALAYVAFPVLLVVYFLPTAVARRRGIRNAAGVILLNLFFGWSLIGWFAALAWAVAGAPAARQT